MKVYVQNIAELVQLCAAFAREGMQFEAHTDTLIIILNGGH